MDKSLIVALVIYLDDESEVGEDMILTWKHFSIGAFWMVMKIMIGNITY